MRHDPLQHPQTTASSDPLQVHRLSEPIHTQLKHSRRQLAATSRVQADLLCWPGSPPEVSHSEGAVPGCAGLLPSQVQRLPSLAGCLLQFVTALSSRPAAAAWLLSPTHPKHSSRPMTTLSSAPFLSQPANFWLDHRLLWPPPSDPSTETACPRASTSFLRRPTRRAMLSGCGQKACALGVGRQSNPASTYLAKPF